MSDPTHVIHAPANHPDRTRRYLMRGVRGATFAAANSRQPILEVTRELLERIVELNHIDPEDVASILFTATPDLTAAFPAAAARELLGWRFVPLINAQEIPVPEAPTLCVRVLVHWNTDRLPHEVQHVYLRGAEILRPDLTQSGTGHDQK